MEMEIFKYGVWAVGREEEGGCPYKFGLVFGRPLPAMPVGGPGPAGGPGGADFPLLSQHALGQAWQVDARGQEQQRQPFRRRGQRNQREEKEGVGWTQPTGCFRWWVWQHQIFGCGWCAW